MVRVLMEVILHLSLSNHGPLFIQSLSWLVHSPLLLCNWNVFGGAPPRQTHFHPHSFKNLFPRTSDELTGAKHYCSLPAIKSNRKGEIYNFRSVQNCPNLCFLEKKNFFFIRLQQVSPVSSQPSLQCQRKGQRSVDWAKRSPSFKCQLDDFRVWGVLSLSHRRGLKGTLVNTETFCFVFCSFSLFFGHLSKM